MNVASLDRQPARAEGRVAGTAEGGYELIEALPWACAAFACADGALLAVNAAFRDEFGPQPPASRAAFVARFNSICEKRDSHVFYEPLGQRWYRMESRALPFAVPAEAVYLTNISDSIDMLRRHREQHEQLLSTSRTMSVGEMATTLAHELNQPLAAAINYLGGCEQLAAAEPVQARLLQGVQLARRQVERAAQIVGSVREFVRTREPRREDLDAAALIGGVIELLKLEIAQVQVKLTLALPAELPPVYADRVMIEQVLLNLLKNAIEAMQHTPVARRRLSLSARLDYDGMVELRVADQGCGIDEDGLRRLFTPMYTTKPDGLGIGLSICRSIVEYHEGRLFAEPNPEGQGGCAMVFTLPPGRAAG